MKNKRGISTIVATVLILLITITAVGIIWSAVRPIISSSIQLSEACSKATILIETSTGYSCYDVKNKEVNIMVNHGSQDFELAGIQFSISSGGNSKNFIVEKDKFYSDVRLISDNYGELIKMPSKNEEITYVFDFANFSSVENVKIAPIVKIGINEKKCGITSNIFLAKCSSETVQTLSTSYPFGFAGLYNSTEYSWAQELGASFARKEVQWNSIETANDVFSFAGIENTYDLLNTTYNLDTMAGLRSYKGWGTLCSASVGCINPPCPHAFASCPPSDISTWNSEYGYSQNYYDYINKTLTELYGTNRKIQFLIVENEVNTRQFWYGTSDNYTKMRATVYKAVKDFNAKTSSNVKVVDNGIAGGVWRYGIIFEEYCAGNITGAIDLANKFYRRMQAAPVTQTQIANAVDCANPEAKPLGRDYLILKEVFKIEPALGVSTFDYMSYHFYEPWETQEIVIKWIKNEMQKNGYSKPIINSEGGYYDLLRNYSNPELEPDVADDVIKNHVVAFANNVEKWTWVPAQEDYVGEALGSQYKGLISPTGQKYLAFTTYKLMANKLNGFTSIERENSDYTYKFIVNKKPVYVIWADSIKTINFSSKLPGNVNITRTDGSSFVSSSSSIQISQSPIFVEPVQ